MYLDSIALTRTLPCLAEPGKIIVIGKPNRSLDEVLPYLPHCPASHLHLNRRRFGAGSVAYNPEAHTLTFRRPAGFMTLYADRVYITQVSNADEGLELLAALKDAINATWDTSAAVDGRDTRRAARRVHWMCGRCCRRRIASSVVKQRAWPLPWACCNTNAA